MGMTQQVKYYTFDFKVVTNPFLVHIKQKIQSENGKGEGLSPFISRTVAKC